MNHEYLAKTYGVSVDNVKSIRSQPCGRGVIRVDYVKRGRTYFVHDNSDNSGGTHRVVGTAKLWDLLNQIEAAA